MISIPETAITGNRRRAMFTAKWLLRRVPIMAERIAKRAPHSWGQKCPRMIAPLVGCRPARGLCRTRPRNPTAKARALLDYLWTLGIDYRWNVRQGSLQYREAEGEWTPETDRHSADVRERIASTFKVKFGRDTFADRVNVLAYRADRRQLVLPVTSTIFAGRDGVIIRYGGTVDYRPTNQAIEAETYGRQDTGNGSGQGAVAAGSTRRLRRRWWVHRSWTRPWRPGRVLS